MGVGARLYMYVVIVQKFTFAISSPDEFLYYSWRYVETLCSETWYDPKFCRTSQRTLAHLIHPQPVAPRKYITLAQHSAAYQCTYFNKKHKLQARRGETDESDRLFTSSSLSL